MNELPPIGWFRNPGLSELTPLTVTADGHVFGHIAGWGQNHLSFPGKRIQPPRSRTDYKWFHTGSVDVLGDDGEPVSISVGKITQGGGHAGLSLSAADTARYYDDSTSIVAVVCAFEDEHGIAFSGSILPGVDQLSVQRLKACGGVSGDWRSCTPGGGLDLVACLAVPTGGFAIPRARVASGAPLALVAAGVVQPATQFGRAVVEGWRPGNETVGDVQATVTPQFDPEQFADVVAARIEQRQREGALSARHAELVGELDDTPEVFAALLAEVDDSPARAAALFAELDGEDDFNWVEDAGGLPSYIKRIADHLKKDGMDESRAIATAVNAAKKMCSTGDTNFPGKQEVNAGSRAEACTAVEQWEAKKAQAGGDD